MDSTSDYVGVPRDDTQALLTVTGSTCKPRRPMSNNGSDASPFSIARLMNADDDELRAMMGALPPSFADKLRNAIADKPKQAASPESAINTAPAPEPHVTPFASEPVTETKVEPPTPFAFEPPPNFSRVPHDYLLFDPERCSGRALLGVPYHVIDLPKQSSVGKAIVFCAIEPTPCVVSDGRVVDCKPGEDVLVEVSHWLRRLMRGAMDQENVGEIWARPVGKRKTQDGDFLMEWDLRSGRIWKRADFKNVLFKK